MPQKRSRTETGTFNTVSSGWQSSPSTGASRRCFRKGDELHLSGIQKMAISAPNTPAIALFASSAASSYREFFHASTFTDPHRRHTLHTAFARGRARRRKRLSPFWIETFSTAASPQLPGWAWVGFRWSQANSMELCAVLSRIRFSWMLFTALSGRTVFLVCQCVL